MENVQDTIEVRLHCRVARKGRACHYNPLLYLLAYASAGTGWGSHLSRLAHPLSQGLLCPGRLWCLKQYPCQSLLGCCCLRQKSTNSDRGWVPKLGVKKRADLGKGILLAEQIQQGTEVRGSIAGNGPSGSMVCLGNAASLLRGMEEVGLLPPPTGQPLPPPAMGETPTRVAAPKSVATAFWSLPLQATHANPSCGLLYSSPAWRSVSQSASFPSFSPRRETGARGWCRFRAEAKTKTEPQGRGS